jgi:hypothetical protein
MPNKWLQRTRRERRGCNRCVRRAGTLGSSSGDQMQNRFTLLALIFLALGCAACSTPNMHLYEGPPHERAALAVLKVQWKATGPSARIETLDGKPVEKGRAFALNIKEAELLPGEHTLEVSYFSGGTTSLKNIPLTFTCKAGGVYELRVAPIDEGFGGAVGVAAGGRGHWTAWIRDQDTKEVLAGKQRTTALRWYE